MNYIRIIQDVKNDEDLEKIKIFLKKLQEFIPPHPDTMIELASFGNRSYFLTNDGVVVRFAPSSEEGLPFLYIPTRHVSYDDIPPQILNNVRKNLNVILKKVYDTISTWIRSVPNTNPMYIKIQKLIKYLENLNLY
ncbi:MAG: hypothetical protein ACPL1B_02820 [Thermoprotei archaeon]|jgi:hypothetical protein